MSSMEERLDLKQIWYFLRPTFVGTRLRYLGITFLLMVASLGRIGEPLIYGRIIDVVVRAVEHNALSFVWGTLLPLLFAWAILDIASSAANELADFFARTGANVVWSRFWRMTLGRVLSWDPQRFTIMPAGGLAKQLDSAGTATWSVAGEGMQRVFPIFFGVIAFFAVGLWLDWRMTLVSLASIPMLFFMSFIAQRKVEKKQDAVNEMWERFLQRFIEILGNIVPIKSFAAEERMTRLHMRLGEKAIDAQTNISTLWSMLEFATSFARFFGRFAVLGTGLFFISEGTLTLGTLITFMGMLDLVLQPFTYQLSLLMRKISETRSAFARVYPELQKANTIFDAVDAVAFKKVRGEIVIKDVSYRYPEKEEHALKHISLTIPAGTSLALVGPSGSGKSTLVKFFNRFLDPTSGSLTIDGKEMASLRLADVRRAIGFVHQESVLFNNSIAENIRFAKPGATRSEIVLACKQAQAHEFIERLPKKYDTVVGERGVRLSGGERQRLAIARVLLADQPILVLDESTSALDSETELKLQIALRKAMEGRTTIIIAHRLSTIYMADAIAVMERGRIVEYGSHAALLKEGGLYERLWSMQSGGYLDRTHF